MRFRRFTKPGFLKEIGRDLLGRFFGKFKVGLDEKQIELPAPGLKEGEYFAALSRLVMRLDDLPPELIEAIYAVEEMTTEQGEERLQAAVERSELALTFQPESSRGDIAMQAYLAAPEVLAQQSNELRLARLTAFEYYGSKASVDRSDAFGGATKSQLELITSDLDEWFRKNNRGEEDASIEPYSIDGEFWFLVRHGDTFARMAKLEKGRRFTMLHFRPAKDDVVVYCPERDELRIHAGTKGERELYQTAFGQRLFGNDKHFSERKAFTLEPLRVDGPAALDWTGADEVDRIVLREIEVAFPGAYNEVLIRKADDIFAAADAKGWTAIPEGGRLARAAFDFWFIGARKPRKVQVRPPNILKLGQHCDAAVVQRWLSEKRFRDTVADRPVYV
jgi:hypothetical protein